jgi:hypothetical protein
VRVTQERLKWWSLGQENDTCDNNNTKNKTVGFFFFPFFGGVEWAKRNAHSLCGKRSIKTRRSWSYSSNPGLSIARSASLYEPIFDAARGFEKWD